MIKLLMFIVIVVLLVTMINGSDLIIDKVVKETDSYKLWENNLGNKQVYVFEAKKGKSVIPNDFNTINTIKNNVFPK